MIGKGALDRWLDKLLGGGKTPNLPSRLVGCDQCKKIWNVNRTLDLCRHFQVMKDETWWNYFRSLLA